MKNQNNNLNLIRIIAALQVAMFHGIKYFELETITCFYILKEILMPFPGVPIFFAISGFLILRSYENRINNKYSFWQSRILRLFPALIVCSLFTLILLVIERYPLKDLLIWFIAQVSFFQFYTPESLRSWGVGTPNGSLWTICVEMQFYLSIPVLYYLLRKFNKKIILALLFIISYGICIWSDTLNASAIWTKLLDVSLLPYLFYFIFGIVLSEYRSTYMPFIANQFWKWFAIYLIYYSTITILGLSNISYHPNLWGLLGYGLLIMSVFSLAFSYTSLNLKILGTTDLSYGVYLYHMPVINLLFGLTINLEFKVLIWFVLTIMVSFLSWIFIEKKAMDLKARSK